jgi:hypothetical protein
MSGNPQKRKGTGWESDARDAFGEFFGQRYGLDPYRPAQQGATDVGDLGGIPPFAVQCKNYANVADALREGLAGAERQKVHARQPYGVALVKRARQSVGQGYAVMSVETFARLVLRLARAEALMGERLPPRLMAAYRHEVETDLARPFPKP